MLSLPPDDPRYAFILAETRYTLNQQNEELRWLQNRAGQILQFGGLIAAFLGSLAIRDKAPLTIWIFLAACAFGTLTLAVVVAVWPRSFEFSVRHDLIEGLIKTDAFNAKETQLVFAKLLSFPYKDNQPKIQFIMRVYVLGILALVAELVCLLVALAVR